MSLLIEAHSQLAKILFCAFVKKVQASVLGGLRDHREFAVVPLIPFHSFFYRKQKLRLDFTYDLVTEFERRSPVRNEVPAAARGVDDQVVFAKMRDVLLDEPHHKLREVSVREKDPILDAKVFVNSVKRFVVSCKEVVD